MTELATQEVARARAAQIRAGIQNYLHTLGNIAAAYAQRDWTALGYGSWESYVDGEYGADRLHLSPEHRQKAVAELRLANMSQRAIGTVLGVSQETVRRDLAGDSDVSPAVIQGADGKTYAATRTSSPTGPESAPIAELPQDPDRSGPMPGEVEAHGTDFLGGTTGSPSSTSPAGPGDAGDSVPVASVEGSDATGIDTNAVDAYQDQFRFDLGLIRGFIAAYPPETVDTLPGSLLRELFAVLSELEAFTREVRGADEDGTE